MAVKTFTTGEVLTASDTNTYLNNGGLVYVTSTTIGSAVSSVTISNCFSSTYDNYRIIVRSSGTTIDWLRISYSGSSGSTYSSAMWNSAWGSGASNSAPATTTFGYLCTTGASFACIADIYGPYTATETYFAGDGPGTSYYGKTIGRDSSTASSTGFTLTPGSGTISGGTITVMGYRKV